jgi:hypothetical protein
LQSLYFTNAFRKVTCLSWPRKAAELTSG